MEVVLVRVVVVEQLPVVDLIPRNRVCSVEVHFPYQVHRMLRQVFYSKLYPNNNPLFSESIRMDDCKRHSRKLECKIRDMGRPMVLLS